MNKLMISLAMILTLSLGLMAQAKDCCNGSSACCDKACCKNHKK